MIDKPIYRAHVQIHLFFSGKLHKKTPRVKARKAPDDEKSFIGDLENIFSAKKLKINRKAPVVGYFSSIVLGICPAALLKKDCTSDITKDF